MIPPEGGCLSPAGRRPDYKIDPDTGCWNWQKSVTAFGYGEGSFEAAGIHTRFAHRAYYMAAHGIQIESGVASGVIDHLCRNKRCVNPDHLELVHNSENVRRGSHAKLTLEQAREIRSRVAAGEAMASLAAEFGTSGQMVFQIVEDTRWRENHDEPRSPVRAQRRCPECGTLITDGNRLRRFCSVPHRSKYADRLRRGLPLPTWTEEAGADA